MKTAQDLTQVYLFFPPVWLHFPFWMKWSVMALLKKHSCHSECSVIIWLLFRCRSFSHFPNLKVLSSFSWQRLLLKLTRETVNLECMFFFPCHSSCQSFHLQQTNTSGTKYENIQLEWNGIFKYSFYLYVSNVYDPTLTA